MIPSRFTVRDFPVPDEFYGAGQSRIGSSLLFEDICEGLSLKREPPCKTVGAFGIQGREQRTAFKKTPPETSSSQHFLQ
jgi:hypothetical protein